MNKCEFFNKTILKSTKFINSLFSILPRRALLLKVFRIKSKSFTKKLISIYYNKNINKITSQSSIINIENENKRIK